MSGHVPATHTNGELPGTGDSNNTKSDYFTVCFAKLHLIRDLNVAV